MGPFQAVATDFSKYVTFSGRARRAEYWWWILFYFVAFILGTMVDLYFFGTTVTTDAGFSSSTSFAPVTVALALVLFLPTLAVTVRRLHDTNRSGWWMLISLVPIVGPILMIVWCASAGTRGGNRFGPDEAISMGGAHPAMG